MVTALACLSSRQDRPPPQFGRIGPAQPREWTSAHPINLRLSLPLVFGRYYVTIVAGRESRGAARLAEERKKHPLTTAGNSLFLTAIIGIAAIAIDLSCADMVRNWL